MSISNFPDINVWVALMWRSHSHYEVTREWFLSSNQYNYFCRQTQLGFLRLVTTRSVLGPDTKSMRQAWSLWDEIWGYQRIGFHAEPSNLEPVLRSYSQDAMASPKRWGDDYLLAFATAANLRLVTIDRALAARSKDAILLKS